MKYPIEDVQFHKDENIQDLLTPETRFTTDGSYVTRLPGYAGSKHQTTPGSKIIQTKDESESASGNTNPGTLGSGSLGNLTKIKIGKKLLLDGTLGQILAGEDYDTAGPKVILDDQYLAGFDGIANTTSKSMLFGFFLDDQFGWNKGDFVLGDYLGTGGLYWNNKDKTMNFQGTFQTGISPGKRMILSSATNDLKFYDEANDLRLIIGGTETTNVIYVDDDDNNSLPAVDIRRSVGQGEALHIESSGGHGIGVNQTSNTPAIFAKSDMDNSLGQPFYDSPIYAWNARPQNTNYYRTAIMNGSSTLGGLEVNFWLANNVSPDTILYGYKGDVAFGTDGKLYINQSARPNGGTSWKALYGVGDQTWDWGYEITSATNAELIGLTAIIAASEAATTSGFYVQANNTQGNIVFCFQADMGTSTKTAGFHAFGSATEDVTADSKMFIGWERTAELDKRIYSAGHGVYNESDPASGYHECLFIRSDGAICFTNGNPAHQHFVGFVGSTGTAADTVWILPETDGSSGQMLKTNGSGTLSWGTAVTSVSRIVQLKIFSDSQAVTTGDNKIIFFIPTELNGYLITAVASGVSTVSSSGTPEVQIRNVTDSEDILSTKLTIDANEYTSYTAATPAVIDADHDDVATGDRLSIDVDTAGTGTKGLTVWLTFTAA